MRYLFIFLAIQLFIPGLTGQVYIFNEDFVTSYGTNPPSEWSNYKITGTTNDLWHFDNPGERVIAFPETAPFAIFDASFVSSNGSAEKVVLESPFFDASISDFILLEVDHCYFAESGSIASVEAYNGTEWIEVKRYTMGTNNTTVAETIDISQVVGGHADAKIRFVWDGNSAGYWAVDNISVLSPLPVDGGLIKIDAPVEPFTPGLQSLNISIGNYGYHQLTSTTVKWLMNGIPQPDYVWNGNLSFGQVQEHVHIGVFNFAEGDTEAMIWQSQPNGLEDPNPFNDTLRKTFNGSLCGEYTIGGEYHDFENFTQAAQRLNIAGMTCPVVFKVRAGYYNETVVLNDIPGNSTQNSITFESESGDSSAVIVSNNIWGTPTFSISNLTNIHFNKIGLSSGYQAMQADDVSFLKFSNCFLSGYYGLVIANHSHDVELSQCRIEGNYQSIAILSESYAVNIHNSNINGGTWGIVVQNGVLNPGNVSINNNIFTGQSYASINTGGTRNLHIEGNSINSNSTGIYADNVLNINILRNRMLINSGSIWHNSGIRFENATDTANITNNFITTVGNYPSDGIFLQNSNHTNVMFNSIFVAGNGPLDASHGCFISNGNNLDMRNNISVISQNGLPIHLSGVLSNVLMDYNDYFHPEGLIGMFDGIEYSAIGNWQAATSYDMNSLSENPFYNSTGDLSINQALLNNRGIEIEGIETDLDGTIRNAEHPDIGAREYTPCNTDAGINGIIEPISPITPGQKEVKVILQNQGNSQLTSTEIHWMVNDAIQPVFVWNGTLPAMSNILINIGSYNFQRALNIIKVWTHSANGLDDCNPRNDTTSKTLIGPLCGEYTIGGLNPDFNDFVEVADVLNNAGIGCPVLFKVRNGTYNAQVILKEIEGSSVLNTITFESESGDSTGVILTSDWPHNAIQLIKTKHIRFKKLGFNGRPHGIQLNQAIDIKVENCYFTGNLGMLANDTSSQVQMNYNFFQNYDQSITLGNGTNQVQIQHCVFEGASHGVVIQTGQFSAADILIENNNFFNQGRSSLHLDNCKSVNVQKNNIQTNLTGFYINNSRNIIIAANRIQTLAQNSNWISSGIHIDDAVDTLSIINNFINTSGIYSSIGIVVQNSNHAAIAYNSIQINNTDVQQSSKGIFINGGGQVTFLNNISCVSAKGYPVFIATKPTELALDYQAYYHPNQLVGRTNDENFYALETWKNAVNAEEHSLFENPFFTSETQPDINQVLLNNAGFFIPGVLTDIDGDVRNMPHPDIGAKEFEPCTTDAGINKIASPSSPVSVGNQVVRVILQNQGATTLTSSKIRWEVNGHIQPSFNWSGSLVGSAQTEVAIGSFDFVRGLYTIKAWTTEPNGVLDCAIANDTIIKKVSIALCGNYTVGGSGADFETFGELTFALSQAGISCPVVFNIRTGEYNEQIYLEQINGNSETNSITFQSESGDSSSVVLGYYAANNTTFHLNNVLNFYLKRISIQGNWGLMIDNSRLIHLQNCDLKNGVWARFNSKYIEVMQSSFSGGLAIESGTQNIDITSSVFDGGGIGIGNDYNNSVNNVAIHNNDFSQGAGISTSFANNISFTGNRFESNQSAIRCYHAKNIYVQNNFFRVYQTFGWDNIGLRFENVDTLLVLNNYLYSYGESAGTSILLNNCYNSRLIFNSFNYSNNDGQSGGAGLQLIEGSMNTIKNNILNLNNKGFPIIIQSSSANYNIDYNNYYSPLGIVGRHNNVDYFDLSFWGPAITGDANSKEVPAFFAADSIPMPFQRAFNGAAIPMQDVLLDIYGNIRNDQAPDMGCVEFMIDFGITQLVSPNLECTHGSSDSVTVYLRQFGDIPFKDIRLSYQMNNGPVVTDTIPGTIYNDMHYTFKTPANMAPDGEYTFRIWLISTRDDNINNDTLIVKRYTKPAPLVDFNWSNNCTGREVFFEGTATVIEPYFIEHFDWDFGDGHTEPNQNTSHLYDHSDIYTVRLRAYSDAGCYNEINKYVEVTDYAKMQYQINTKDETCNNACDGSIQMSIEGGAPPFLNFVNGQPRFDLSIEQACKGAYYIKSFDSKGCEIADTIIIATNSPMNLEVIADPMQDYAPFDVNLSSIATGASSFEWRYNGGLISTGQNTVYTMTNPGLQTFTLLVSSGPPNFCILKDSVSIMVDVKVEIYIPNAFTPNGDGYNDTFGISSKGLKSMEMKIKDRNGRLVFTITSVDGRWDGGTSSGDEAPQGIYYFTLTATGYDNQIYREQGSVSLFRDLIDLTPNPVKGSAVLDLSGWLSEKKVLSIYNTSGLLVRKWETLDVRVTINLNDLSSGLYTLQITGEDQTFVVKFVKE